MPDDSLPSADDILDAHEEIEEAYDMKYRGIRVAAPRTTLREILDGAREYDDLYLRAAHLLRKLITSHIFEDGNKRTAWVVTREYLRQHDVEPGGRNEEVERVLRRIRRYDVAEIADWLDAGELDRDRLNP